MSFRGSLPAGILFLVLESFLLGYKMDGRHSLMKLCGVPVGLSRFLSIVNLIKSIKMAKGHTVSV